MEKLQLILTRKIGFGDTWCLTTFDEPQSEYPTLTDALEAYFNIATVKPKAFRLDLIKGKIYSIFPQEVEIIEPEVKKYSIYGDYISD
jgi:hypothetical protein